MTSDSQKREPFFERRGWIILIVESAIFLLFGFGDVVLGMNADPAIAEGITGVSWEDLQASRLNPLASEEWSILRCGTEFDARICRSVCASMS